ncbi:MAG: DUF4832 domain-containing protein [Candidatus Hydrogenedens sp.]
MKMNILHLFLILFLCSSATFTEISDWETISLSDTGEALQNPGMGWVLHFYDNVPENYGSKLAPSDTVDEFPALSVIYLRIAWSFLEPEEGKYNWSILDTPSQRWISKGKQIALRITCSETPIPWATPKWVYEAGAKGNFFIPTQGIKENGTHWEPEFDDPVFLDKLDNFLAVLAKRYDENPEIAFIDMGSLGVWGEGHVWHSTQKHISTETIKKHIDLHIKHFKNTIIALNDDLITNGQKLDVIPEEKKELLNYAIKNGLTLRDDSILVQGGDNVYFSASLAEYFWRNRPIILESEHYGPSKAERHWGDGSKYLQAVEDYHASYTSIHWWPREFLQENKDLIDKINLRLGYRIVPTEVKWQKTVKISEKKWDISYRWANKGVAPCYRDVYPIITWKDEKGGIVAVFTDETFNLKQLPIGKQDELKEIEVKKSFFIPFLLKEGNYTVFISAGSITGTPEIQLPLNNTDHEKRYVIGKVNVVL